MCHTLKSVKLSKNIGKIGILTEYKVKIGQMANFLSFSGKYLVIKY